MTNPVWHRILYSNNRMATVGVKGLLSSLSLNFLVRLIASNIRPDVKMTVSYRTRLGGTDALADTTVALLMREHSSSCFLDTKVAVYMCTKAVFIGLTPVSLWYATKIVNGMRLYYMLL